MKEKPECRGNHRGHLCVLVSEKKLDVIRDLVKHPKFICFNCGRAANSRRNLCNPMPLEEKQQGAKNDHRS